MESQQTTLTYAVRHPQYSHMCSVCNRNTSGCERLVILKDNQIVATIHDDCLANTPTSDGMKLQMETIPPERKPMQLSPQQRAALKNLITAKLMLWDYAQAAETLLNRDLDINSDHFEGFCAGIDTGNDVHLLSDEALAEAFELKDQTPENP